jgi:hypothetical protein
MNRKTLPTFSFLPNPPRSRGAAPAQQQFISLQSNKMLLPRRRVLLYNHSDMKKQGLFNRVAGLFLLILVALWMLFEDWVWDRIVALMEVAGRLKSINRFETFLAKQNRYLLLAFFTFPFLIMIPAKLYGLFLIASGKVVRGVIIFVMAKALITALVTRLFVISRDKLLKIEAFAAFYYWFKRKKAWLYSEVRKLPGWQTTRIRIAKIKTRLRSFRRKER